MELCYNRLKNCTIAQFYYFINKKFDKEDDRVRLNFI